MKNKEILWSDRNITIHPKVKIRGQVLIMDYSNLVNGEGQRSLTAKGIMQLTASVDEVGLCTCPVVIKGKDEYKGKYIVVDGWHRVTVAKKNNTDIICDIVDPDCTIQELMVILNTTMINWRPKDFLNFGITYHNNKDYVLLNEIWEETGISLIALYTIFSYDLTATEAKRRFERGIWLMSTKFLGNRVISYAQDINKYMPFSCNANFLRGFVKCVDKMGFNFEHLLSQIKKFPNHIHDGDKPNQHAEMINKIYNHCALEEEQVYLA